MEQESVVQLTFVSRVVGVDGGDQSIQLTTPSGHTFRLPEVAWRDLEKSNALIVLEAPTVKVGDSIEFGVLGEQRAVEVLITEAVVPPVVDESPAG